MFYQWYKIIIITKYIKNFAFIIFAQNSCTLKVPNVKHLLKYIGTYTFGTLSVCE